MVSHDRAGAPVAGTVLSRTSEGERTFTRVRPDDPQSIAFLTDRRLEPIGAPGTTTCEAGDLIWRAA